MPTTARELAGVATLGGHDVYYRIDGPVDAPVLVLSNSLGTNLRMWDAQMSQLASRWRVLRHDMRGHGRSGVPRGPYTVAQLTADITDLLDFLGVGQVHFCGMSLGGLVGMCLAREEPGRISRLVVCSAAARMGTTAGWSERIAAVRAGGMQAVAGAVTARWFTEDFRTRAPDAVRSIEQQLLDTSTDGYVACCAAVRDADLRSTVSTIHSPTLVLAGTHDPVVPTADVRWLAEHIPGARYAELPTAHLSNVERAAEFTDQVSAFLAA
jgi:3-oxoadipate enol-lactonase